MSEVATEKRDWKMFSPMTVVHKVAKMLVVQRMLESGEQEEEKLDPNRIQVLGGEIERSD